MRAASVVLLLALLLGCTAGQADQVQPRDGRSGLQGTGTLDGVQVAVAGGLPDLVTGCRAIPGADPSVCFLARTIDGRSFVVILENPEAYVEGEALPVGDPPCASPEQCAVVDDEAVVALRLDGEDPVRATGGQVRMTRVVPSRNYVGELNLQLPGGRFSATFDVVPRPD